MAQLAVRKLDGRTMRCDSISSLTGDNQLALSETVERCRLVVQAALSGHLVYASNLSRQLRLLCGPPP